MGAVLHSERNTGFASSRLRLAFALTLGSASLFLTACGSNYRPVISAINPVGPAGQPTKYAVVISTTGASTPGLVTLVDFSGDTILNTTALGNNPFYFAIDPTGSDVYDLNGDGTINSFGISSSLIQSNVNQSSLPAGSLPTTVVSQGSSVYITQSGLNSVAQLTGLPPAIKQELPTGAGTVYTVSASAAPRVYAIVQNGSSAGHAAAIETTTQTISNSIPVGVTPVYGVMTADARRAFIMNKGSNTVTVINAQQNELDDSTAAPDGTIAVGTAPVWADFAPTLNEMLVVNQGNPATCTTAGGPTCPSVSVVSIPLCTASTVTSNPNCDVSNPVDASGFASVVATIPLVDAAGKPVINPVMIVVAQDGSQAFVANQGIPNTANPAASTPGSVSVINLSTNSIAATIPAEAQASASPTDASIHGNPTWIAVTTGLPTGKCYVTSNNSTDLTIIRTDTNSVVTHLGLLSTGVQVRTNLP